MVTTIGGSAMKIHRGIVVGALLLTAGFLSVGGMVKDLLLTDVKSPGVQQRGLLHDLREIAAKDGRLDYLVLGDSVALGKGSAKEEGYGYWVAEYLKDNGIDVHLDNRAVSGQTSDQLLRSLGDRDLLSQIERSDLISITIGGNDLLKVVLHHENPLDALKKFRHIQDRYRDNLHAILEQIRLHNPRAPILITSLYNPVEPEEPYFPIVQKLLKQWNAGMKEVVRTYPDASVIDVDRRLPPNDRNWLADEIHPNDWGYQLMAKGMLESIRGKVSEAVSEQ